MLQVANIRQGMDLGLMLTGVPLVVLSRALNIYPLAYLVNKGGPILMYVLPHWKAVSVSNLQTPAVNAVQTGSWSQLA